MEKHNPDDVFGDFEAKVKNEREIFRKHEKEPQEQNKIELLEKKYQSEKKALKERYNKEIHTLQERETYSKGGKPKTGLMTIERITYIAIIVLLLSVNVVQNLLSQNQAMNTSFNQLHLVNTYGAFGSIGKVRNELIIQGTTDTVITETTVWKEYEFKAKPGDVNRKFSIVAPYQPRIDW